MNPTDPSGVQREGVKLRAFRRECLTVPLCGIDEPESQLCEKLDHADLVFLDGQHGCFSEERLPGFCERAAAFDVPVLYRIRHPELAFLIGTILDHGPLGIVLPQVETAEQVRRAVDAFYYPPLGNRGWGPRHGFGRKAIPDRRAYADWWNANGLLAIQLESVAAIRDCRQLALAGLERGFGLDLVLFGPVDLTFSLEADPDGSFTSLDDCYNFVRRALAELPVKVSVGGDPFGEI